jgi:chromosome segregation ATPase
LKQPQDRAQEELTRLRDALQKLEQERVAMEVNLNTLRAQLAEITRQPGRTPDGATR